MLAALSSIASEQAKSTEGALVKLKHMLDYLGTHPDATVRFYASDMILNIHSDASYISKPGGKSRDARHFFLGWLPRDGAPIHLNGAFFALFTILKFVAALAAEARYILQCPLPKRARNSGLENNLPLAWIAAIVSIGLKSTCSGAADDLVPRMPGYLYRHCGPL